MFREKNSITPILPENFGAGSIIKKVNESTLYLVISHTDSCVQLLDLKTFRTFSRTLSVEDANYLTINEVSDLISCFDYSFADLNYIPLGLKKFKISELDTKTV